MTNRVEHVKEERNVADVFSRPTPTHSDLNSILLHPESFVIDYIDMATEQQNDQDVQNLKNNNGTNWPSLGRSFVKRYWHDYFVRQFSKKIKTCHS